MAVPTLSASHQTGAYAQSIRGSILASFPSEWQSDLQHNLDHVVAIIGGFFEKAAALARSDQFSKKGLDDRRTEMAENASGELRQFELRVILPLERKLQDEREAASATPRITSESPVVEFLREQELRALLRDKDPLHIHFEYIGAARSGDNNLLLAAVDHAPIPMISPATRKEADELKVRRLSPHFGDMESLLSTYRTLVSVARNDLGIV